jgi:hypothetical protein
MACSGYFRVADDPEVIRPNHVKGSFLLKICRIKHDYSYLLTGTLRRTSRRPPGTLERPRPLTFLRQCRTRELLALAVQRLAIESEA